MELTLLLKSVAGLIVILGILVSPIIFIVSGFSGLKECYFEHKDLSYSTYLSWKKSYWKNRGN